MTVRLLFTAMSLGLLCVLGSGCESSEDTGPGRSTAEARATGPRFAVMYEVFDDVGSNSYLALVDSVDSAEIKPEDSREFAGGRAFLRSYDGDLFVGSPEAPIVTRYAVSQRGELEAKGEVSFAQFGLSKGEIDAWTTTFISKTKAYTFDTKQATTIVWNPQTMEVTGEIQGVEALIRDGWTLEGTPGVVRGDRLFRMFDWVDDTGTLLGQTRFAVFDVANDELLEIIDEPRCSAMGNLVHEAEDGAFYFSNWIWSVGHTLQNEGPKNCVLRVGPDSDRPDPDFELKFSDLTAGREGAMFTYLGDRKALFSAYYHEEAEYDGTTEVYDVVAQPFWHVWSVDLDTREAAPLSGIAPNTGAFTPIRVDDRTYLMIPGESWETTRLYRMAEDGPTPAIEVPGWTYQFAQIR